LAVLRIYVSFAIALDTFYKGELYDAILFFDDGGVNYEDDNHDDLLIGIKAKANVPESSALILMLMGLAGLVAVRRTKLSQSPAQKLNPALPGLFYLRLNLLLSAAQLSTMCCECVDMEATD